ncbi:MAG: serine hydrolase [Weeksellaceae bacterium]|nr:serine hydrolase [Weeksellaceae bacterium]
MPQQTPRTAKRRVGCLPNFLRIIFVGVLLLVALLFITGNQYIIRGVQLTYLKGKTTANIYDYKDFGNRLVLSAAPQPWDTQPDYNQQSLPDSLLQHLEQYSTDAFLVIKDGKLWQEHYFQNRKSTDISNSFSIAKSVVTMLMFKAIEDGYIQSTEQKITDFLPEYKEDSFGSQCTIGHLSAMTSGYDWQEDYYLPLNPTAKAYYGTDIEKQMLQRGFDEMPGSRFEYLSGATQLLAIIIQRATNKPISTYLTESFWQPMGMEQDAQWSLDANDEMEKAYCCLNATARDFAKLGQLLLQHGNWNGRQLLSKEHVQKMVQPNLSAFASANTAQYGYSIWTDYSNQPQFYAMLGHLGQRVIVIPEINTVIVRLGHEKDDRKLGMGTIGDATGSDTYIYVNQVYKMIKNQ